jgi:hypothetical protein
LLKHLKSKTPSITPEKQQLLSDPEQTTENQPIFFQLTTKHVLASESAPVFKPLTIPLPHSPYPSTASALVITKDPQEPFVEKCKGNPRVQMCLGMGAIRKSYNSYEQLRRLRDGEVIGEEPALVLSDEAVVVSLPKVLGKAFYKTPRTTPVAVKMTPATISKVVEEAFTKTYVRKNAGNCVAIKIGYVGMEVDALIDNCIATWTRCVTNKKLVKDGIEGLRSCFIKSGSSVALPVWMADDLHTDGDVLDGPVVKKIKSKVDRKLVKEKPVEVAEPEENRKRDREDDVEKSFEERRARKLAKQDKKVKVVGLKAVKA